MTYELTVHAFEIGTDKESANKVLEEASEAREAAQQVRNCNPSNSCREYNCLDTCEELLNLADELADVIQAACNLAERYDIDLQAAMERCERRNRDRGRYECDFE